MSTCVNVSIDVVVGSVLYHLEEGYIVRGLTYKDRNNEITIDGAVRVINGSTVKTTTQKSCPPERYLDKMFSCDSIVVDTSKKYKASFVTVPVSSILNIVEIDTGEEEPGGAVPIVDDVEDIPVEELYPNLTVLDRIEE